MKKPIDISNTNGLTHLKANSLFDDRTEIFDAQSGKWLGSMRKGEAYQPNLFELPTPIEKEKAHKEEPVNHNQITLF